MAGTTDQAPLAWGRPLRAWSSDGAAAQLLPLCLWGILRGRASVLTGSAAWGRAVVLQLSPADPLPVQMELLSVTRIPVVTGRQVKGKDRKGGGR